MGSVAQQPMDSSRATLLVSIDSALAIAEKANARKHAPATYARAKAFRRLADSLSRVSPDNLTSAREMALQAVEMARHASVLANRITADDRERYTRERQWLRYEEELSQLALIIGESLSPTPGPDSAREEFQRALAAYRDLSERREEELRRIESAMREFCVKAGVQISANATRGELFAAVEDEFTALVQELDDLRGRIRHTERTLAQTQQEKEAADAILAAQEAAERTFGEVKGLFTPAEALVLRNASDDIVIRLRGLIFESGESKLTEDHNTLLAKVVDAMSRYPSAKTIVEGHTDNVGLPSNNQKLSEKRAQEVMEYLVTATARPSEDFQGVGYGAEKPVANNATAQGRAENRRIDIVIVRR